MHDLTNLDFVLLICAALFAFLFLVAWRFTLTFARVRVLTMDQSARGLVSDALTAATVGFFLLGLMIIFATLATWLMLKALSVATFFEARGNLFGILMFFIDQSLKGILGDLLEVFEVTLPFAAVLDPYAAPGFALFITVYRAFAAGLILVAVVTMFQMRKRELVYELGGNRIAVDRHELADHIVKSQPFYAMIRRRAAELGGSGWRARATDPEPLFEAAFEMGPHLPIKPVRGE